MEWTKTRRPEDGWGGGDRGHRAVPRRRVQPGRVLPTTALSGSGEPNTPTWVAGTARGGAIPTLGAAQGPVSQAQAAGWGLGTVWGSDAPDGSASVLAGVTTNVWSQAFGGSDAVTGTGDPDASASAETTGALAGYDYLLSTQVRVGIVVGNWQSDLTMNDGTGESAGLTTGLDRGWVVDALAGYTFDTDVVQRPLAFVGRTATGTHLIAESLALSGRLTGSQTGA